MSLADTLVITFYIGLIFVVAFYSGRSKRNLGEVDISEQFLAGRSLTFTESLCSIIATEVSALTFLGIPAFAYSSNYSFLQIYIGAILGRFFIARILLPKLYNNGLTIFETMSKSNSTPSGRKTITSFYMLNKFLAVGVRLYSGSILIAEFFQLSIYTAIVIICALTFFYTLIGGLKAVVRTDIMQMALFILGGLLAHKLIPEVSGESWSGLMTKAFASGKTSLYLLNSNFLLTGIIGGVLFDIATHGVDQDFVQRQTGNKTLKSAQRAIFFSSFFSILVGLLFLGIGSLLWAHYQSSPLPEGVKPDYLFAYFITHYFPNGMKGLMVAGVLAATMSTLDSTINALSSCLYNDIFHHREPNKVTYYYRRDTLIITVILMLIAFAASLSENLLIFGLKMTSWTAGPLLAVSLAKILFKKLDFNLNWFSVLGTYLFGCSAVAINTFIWENSWYWNVYYGFIAGTFFLILYNTLGNRTK